MATFEFRTLSQYEGRRGVTWRGIELTLTGPDQATNGDAGDFFRIGDYVTSESARYNGIYIGTLEFKGKNILSLKRRMAGYWSWAMIFVTGVQILMISG